MIIIHKGKKMIEGLVDELLDPAHTLIEINAIDNQLALQQIEASPFHRQLLPGKSIRLEMNKMEVPVLISTLTNNGVQLLSVNASHSLENYFLSLTTQTGHVEPFAN
jgi:hypothetical protein